MLAAIIDKFYAANTCINQRNKTSNIVIGFNSDIFVGIFNNITRNIIPSNVAEILLVYYGFRVHPQAHGYTILAFRPRVFQGYRIYLIPWEDHSRENRCDIPAQGLILLIEYSYQQVAKEADLERTIRLSMLGLEQFWDG